MSYHFDHTINRAVKGINIVSALFHSRDVSIPVGVEFVNKDIEYTDKEGKIKQKASVNRNEQFRNLVMHEANNLGIRYMLCDTWYATVKNMRFIVEQAQTNFVMAVKDNRRGALSLADKRAGRYRPITETVPEGFARIVWLEKLDFPVLITKQVFNNADGSCGILYPASSDLGLDAQRMAAIYQQPWNVEQYHKSLKQIGGLGQSPSWKIHTQRSHLCASVMAYVKLELYK